MCQYSYYITCYINYNHNNYNNHNQVYLIDYGLAFRFNVEGKHKEYKEDPKKAHDGTTEYASRDAHKGVCKWNAGSLLAALRPRYLFLLMLILRQLSFAQ